MRPGSKFAFAALLAASARAGNLEKLFLDDQAALTSGAVVAAGSEAGSAWYNPAGLAEVDRTEVKLGASAYAARFFSIPKYMQIQLPDSQGTLPLFTRSFFSTPSSLVYASRFGESLGAAFSVFTRDQLDVFDMNSQVFKGRAANGEDYVAEVGAELDIRAKEYLSGPAVGWKPASWLSLGTGLYGAYSRLGFSTRYWSDYYHPSSQFAPGPFYATRILFRHDERFAASQVALRSNSGAQLALPWGFKLGLALHSPKFQLYNEYFQDAVLDGAVTTTVASAPSGIVLQFHQVIDISEHPYSWDKTDRYRGFVALAKELQGGYVSAEADFSDYPAEAGRGAIWNFRVGGIREISPHLSLGLGAYTDHADPKVDMRQFAKTMVNYYGGTMGLRYVTLLNVKEESGKTRPLHLTTTLSLHYQRGYGEFAGRRVDVTDLSKFPFPNGGTDYLNEEVSAHLGGGFVF